MATSDHIKASPAKALLAKILPLLSKIMLTYTLILSTKRKPIRQGVQYLASPEVDRYYIRASQKL